MDNQAGVGRERQYQNECEDAMLRLASLARDQNAFGQPQSEVAFVRPHHEFKLNDYSVFDDAIHEPSHADRRRVLAAGDEIAEHRLGGFLRVA